MEIDIGYMQVHIRLYENDKLYEKFAINAFDGCYCVNTELISSHHAVVDDKAGVYDKIFEIILKVFASDYTILMHMPIHQSEKWEIIKINDTYTVAFFCNLGTEAKQ